MILSNFKESISHFQVTSDVARLQIDLDSLWTEYNELRVVLDVISTLSTVAQAYLDSLPSVYTMESVTLEDIKKLAVEAANRLEQLESKSHLGGLGKPVLEYPRRHLIFLGETLESGAPTVIASPNGNIKGFVAVSDNSARAVRLQMTPMGNGYFFRQVPISEISGYWETGATIAAKKEVFDIIYEFPNFYLVKQKAKGSWFKWDLAVDKMGTTIPQFTEVPREPLDAWRFFSQPKCSGTIIPGH